MRIPFAQAVFSVAGKTAVAEIVFRSRAVEDWWYSQLYRWQKEISGAVPPEAPGSRGVAGQY
jgi:hypothetical protein